MASLLPLATRKAPGNDKLQHVQRLIDVLRSDLEQRSLAASERATTLEQLKVYGREPADCDPIFTKEGIEILGNHGFTANQDDKASAREALRCLANALLVVPKTRQIFVDLDLPAKAAAKFESEFVDDEFLLARILFLITYDTTADLRGLLKDHKLEHNIEAALARHASAQSTSFGPRPFMDEMALGETLKLTFNISHFISDKEGLFAKTVPHLFAILRRRDLAPFPLQPPVTLLINALINVDLATCKEDSFPPSDPLVNITRLVEILDKSTDLKFIKLGAKAAENFDENGAPLIALFRKIIETGGEDVMAYLKSRLIPSEKERNQPLGKGTSLAARLLQLTTSASAPHTRESIAYLLFELSSSSADEFIQNIGYGYASGFLVTHNIPVPAAFTESGSTSSSSAPSSRAPINPITGQRLESEPIKGDPFAGMTQEEKEREAERLFVLFERHGNLPTPIQCFFERVSVRRLVRRVWANLRPRNRLKKTGVMNVKNPVEQAVEEGRFEELDD